jgi:uncharacterized spore protein YtfJ
MLHTKECAHLNADDWAGIVSKILRPKEGETFLMAVSDGHAGGVTSCMPEVKDVINGCAQHASILLLNGDDFEYESPAAFLSTIDELKTRYHHLKGSKYKEALREEAEAVLHQKVAEDIATLELLITENPDRKIVKVIGNHENFETFRDALTQLAEKHPNFQWTPEVAILPMPGGTKGERDRLLATHGDLQMDDLWFVEEGGTDKERKCYTHQQMAEKAVGIATRYWAPSAQKQEKGQGVVNWWRKPNATAKTLYAELLFRAQEGDFSQALKKTDMDASALETTQIKLEKRQKKFNAFKDELAQREGVTDEQRAAEMQVYDRALETMEQQLDTVKERRDNLARRASMTFPHMLKAPKTVLHYTKLGENEPRLFTSKALGRITHVNYGHTHVSAEAAEIKGMDGKTITVSNNASVTGAIIRQPLDTEGKPRTVGKGEAAEADVGNVGMLIYRVKDGNVTEITTVGRLIAENIHLVRQLIRDVKKQHGQEIHQPGAITPDTIIHKKITGQQDDKQVG